MDAAGFAGLPSPRRQAQLAIVEAAPPYVTHGKDVCLKYQPVFSEGAEGQRHLHITKMRAYQVAWPNMSQQRPNMCWIGYAAD